MDAGGAFGEFEVLCHCLSESDQGRAAVEGRTSFNLCDEFDLIIPHLEREVDRTTSKQKHEIWFLCVTRDQSPL